MNNEFNPPYTDRGVENTSGLILKEKNVLIDWFECTIKNSYDPLRLLSLILQIDSSNFLVEKKAMYSYTEMVIYRDIKLLFNCDNKDLGYHLIMSGRGCRDYEELGLNFLDLFKILKDNFIYNVTRIDVAIDTFTNKYYDMNKLRSYISNGQVVSRFKSSTEFIQKSLSTSDIESETIWFGSRCSDIQVVFYNKLYERHNASYEVDSNINYWFRCEIRFRNERAKTLTECFILNDNYMYVINDVLYNYLDFKDYSVDSNKSRWLTSKWWLDFLDTNIKLSLQVNFKESSISRKKKWIDKSVSKSQLLCYLSDISLNNDYTLDQYT